MNVGVLGISHKQTSLEMREKIIAFCQAEFSKEPQLQPGSVVLLTTCNRCEIYFSGPVLGDIHKKILTTLSQFAPNHFEQKCYTFFGYDCFVHLAKVTLGLDSSVPFETEIQGQVKQAYEQAKNIFCLSAELHFLFQKTLQLGKEMRTQLSTIAPIEDLEHSIFLIARNFFKEQARDILTTSVAIVGCSEINLKVAKYLLRKGVSHIYFCNRTHEKAEYVANTLSTQILPWNRLEHTGEEFDWIITGTKSPTYLLNTPLSNPHAPNKLFIDLAVPRNINPAIIRARDTLLNIDELHAYLDEKKAHLEHTMKYAELRLLEACAQKMHAKREKDTLAKQLCAQ